MKTDHVIDLIASGDSGFPMQRVAAALVRDPSRRLVILNRNDDEVYLVRLWLTPPRLIIVDGDEIIDSSDSLLLHVFMGGDDDASLHDHPWDFVTEIVAGGYTEHYPPHEWRQGSALGPVWDRLTVERALGDRIRHTAASLHCVGNVLPGTMTLVRTGPKIRSWGFHPPGEPWVPWREFLQRRKSSIPAR